MHSAKQCRYFAEQCRRLRDDASTDQQRRVLQVMEQAWLVLAEEAEERASRKRG
ncbi:MAG TPA: hypothetical protein VGF60_12335 [Xanthobacteraceae bacterium]